MRVLRIRLRSIENRLLGHVLRAIPLPDELTDIRQRLIRHAGRVGSHVGNQTDGPFARKLDALVELLRDHHRLLDRKPRGLLELARDERRNGALLPLLCRDGADDPVRLLQVGEDRVGFRLVANLDVRAILFQKTRIELRRHFRGEMRRDVPVLLGDEALDLAFAIDDQLQRNRLDAAGAQAAAHLVPEQRADLVADQPIEHASRLLRVDHLLVDGRRVLHRREDTLLRDLVEHQAPDLLLVPGAELFGQMPADRLPFAVGVGRDVDLGGAFRGVLQLLEDLLPARDDLVGRLESFLDVHTQLALGEVAHVPHRGHDLVVSAQIFIDGFRLRRRFHHDQCLCHD